MFTHGRYRTRAELILEAHRLGLMPFACLVEDGDDGEGDPGSSDGKKKDVKPPRTYTQEEVDRKLRGQGKALEETQAELVKYRETEAERKKAEEEAQRKQLEEQGNFKTLYEQSEAEKAKLQEQLTTHQQSETKRLERVASENTERAEKLPKQYRNLIPSGIDPDSTRLQIERLEALAGQTVRDVKHGGKVKPTENLDEMDDEEWEKRMKSWGESITRGEKFEEGKKK